MLLGTTEPEIRFRLRRLSRAHDCPFCGAVVVVRTDDSGASGMTCRCCGWWRVQRADGTALEESEEYLRRRHAP